MELAVLAAGAFLAGLIDAVVGGGGLVQLPLLLAVFPQLPIPVLFATNKLSSIGGTSVAAVHYSRHVPLASRTVLPAFVCALVGAWLGAQAVSLLPPQILRPAVLVLLVVVGLYTFWQKDFGRFRRPALQGRLASIAAAGAGFLLGFYDGFFGPGTGSFLIFLFVRWFGMDLLQASASAKWVNVATNLAALAYFISHEGVLWLVGLTMAVANIAGSQVGSRLALKHGNGFVRYVLIAVVAVLIAKLSFDMVK